MQRFLLLPTLLLASLALSVQAQQGSKFEMDGLTSTIPANWIKETPTSKLRFAQFRLPKAPGDAEDAELVVFKGFGGSAKENIARWKGQFLPPAGDEAKVEEFKVAGCTVHYVDVSGTYLDGPPMLPAAKKRKKAGFRMLAVQFEAPDNNYHLTLRGPAKTIEAHKKDFDAWLKGFKK